MLLEGGGQALEVAGLHIDVLSVPGHSPGHLAYAVDGVLLSGDVLFAGSVGRTDFPGADWDTLLASIRSLIERLPPETAVYRGTGLSRRLGESLRTNPFLAAARDEGEARMTDRVRIERRVAPTTSSRPRWAVAARHR